MELKVEKLQRQIWGRKSERLVPDDVATQKLLFDDPAPAEETPERAPGQAELSKGQPRQQKDPKPLDPSLPRRTIAVPMPELKQLMCPVTGKPGALNRTSETSA